MIDTSMADGFQNASFQPVSFGMLHTRPIAPNNKALCLYAYPGIGRKHNWGLCKVMCSLLNNHCSAKSDLSNINSEVNWMPQHEEIVAGICGPAANMHEALSIFHNKVKKSVFPEKTVDLVKMQTAAIVNGHHFDAGLASNIKYTNSIYSIDDPSYIVPLQDRIASLKAIGYKHIQDSCKHIEQGKPLMGAVNMSGEQVKAACLHCGEMPASKEYPVVHEYKANSHKTNCEHSELQGSHSPALHWFARKRQPRHGQHENSLQCNGQRICDDHAVYCDKCGYTYGISCALGSTSATPCYGERDVQCRRDRKGNACNTQDA